MKKALKYCILHAFSMLMTVLSSAQGLPSAPRDPSVKNGILPNGMAYYLVTNPTTDNIADFALVQRTGFKDLGEQAGSVAREGLTSLPRLKESPQAFLASHGVAPSKDGFVRVSENATLYHFDNVILTEQAIDSVLLVLMDIVDRGTMQSDSLWQWYAPEDHAVIVSGDIDATSLATKLQMLSYMTPARPSCEREDLAWQDSEEPVFDLTTENAARIATVSAAWTSPRIPKEYMNTVQPLVYSMFVNELGLLAEERLAQRFQKENIPVADISYQHVSSLRTFGAENFVVSVSVSPEHLSKAVDVLASTMSALDRGTASLYEFDMVKRRYFSDLKGRAELLMRSNTNYVEYCASSFLYNAPLASSREIYPFLKYRSLKVDTELTHFNNFASALLDGKKNLAVSCSVMDGSDFTKDQLQEIFQSSWGSESVVFECTQQLDTLLLPPAAEPIKLKKTQKDPMSGGVVWTFENGFRVVYKRQETGRRMHFALALNGGYGNIRGLSHGEGAYVSDYLKLSNVASAPSKDFYLELEKNDLTLNTTVNLSNTIIEGSAPEAKLDMMMQTLLAVVNEREFDKEAFEYYKSCTEVEHELLKGTVRDRIVAIDSLMCPGYEYSPLKTPGKLTKDFPKKVEAFWQMQAGKTNDGVLVLVGNIEETKLRKVLQNYVYDFETTDQTYPRLNVTYQPVSGSTAYTFKGDKNSVDVTLSSRISLTADNYFASNIAASVLKQLISKAIDGTGMYLRLAHECRIYPQERFNVMISLEEAAPQGFATDVHLTGAAEALSILRDVLEDLPNLEINDADLLKHKNVLKGHMAIKVTDPEYWIHALAMRYLDGKDLTTSYESKIDAVSAAKVKSILASLANTSRVEYIIEK